MTGATVTMVVGVKRPRIAQTTGGLTHQEVAPVSVKKSIQSCRRIPPEIEAAALGAYGAAFSEKATARLLGISPGAVRRILRDHHVPQMFAVGSTPLRRRKTYTKKHREAEYRVVLLPRGDPYYAFARRNGTAGWSRVIEEHRLVVAEELGRPLRSDETVHHINGDTLDNRPENLELHAGQHGPGQRYVCAACGCMERIPVGLH